MKKLEKHYDLVALTQMSPASLGAEDIKELQRQLRIRLDREMTEARDEAVRDLLDLPYEAVPGVSRAAQGVIRANWREEGEEEAEETYFKEHQEVLDLYLPRYLLG